MSPVGCTAKFSETPLETAYCREMNIQFTGNSSGGHSCSQHANCMLPSKLATSVALCCVIKLHILEWPFIVASLRHTCAIIMLSNQFNSIQFKIICIALFMIQSLQSSFTVNLVSTIDLYITET